MNFKMLFFLSSVIIVGLSSCKKADDKDTQPNELISNHSLEFSHSIGSPLANTTGVASDQDHLWIMCGEHNASEHTLIYYDEDNYTTLKSFTFNNLIEELGTGVYGISYHDEAVWISVSGNVNKIVKVDTADGSILQTWSSPTKLGPSDIYWDSSREEFWLSTGTETIYTINSISGGATPFYVSEGIPERDCGIVTYQNELWVGTLFYTDLLVYDKQTAEYLGKIPNALQKNGNMCFHKGKLTVVNDQGLQFYDVVE